jgi:hypothetical protein
VPPEEAVLPSELFGLSSELQAKKASSEPQQAVESKREPKAIKASKSFKVTRRGIPAQLGNGADSRL